jgi:phenylalanyl-tRNA synthetase alpha subunit
MNLKTLKTLAWSAYKNFSREVKREIRMAEREFITEQITNNKNNTNSIWKSIRSCIPKKSADEFNHFFASVGESTTKKISALAEELNYDTDERTFIPRDYPLSEQFVFNNASVESEKYKKSLNQWRLTKLLELKISLFM